MSDFITSYVDDILAVAEGTEDHESAEGGAYTAAYGITEVARNRYPKQEGETDRDYAIRVAGEYADQAKEALGSDVWNKMPGYMKVVALDIQYNSSINSNPTFKKNIQKGDYDVALKNTLDIISANDPKAGNVKGTMPGLAKRRAAIYNFAAKEMFLPEIKKVVTSPKEGGGVLTQYLTEKGNKVFEQPTARLHSDASFSTLTPDTFEYSSPSEEVADIEETSEPEDQPNYNLMDYSIRRGDTLFSIANNLGVDVEDLRHFNEAIQNTDTIYPEQVIRVPDQRGARDLDVESLDAFEEYEDDLVPLGA